PGVALRAQRIQAVADDRRGEFQEAEIDVVLRQAALHPLRQRGELGHGAAVAAAMAADHDAGFLEPDHQNSMPFCAVTPARNGCLTSAISVTRSAASISAGGASRPVTTTCRSGGRPLST